MNNSLLAAATLVVAANAFVLPSALDKSSDADRARIATFKADVYDYEQSEQAKTARYANQFIKNNRGQK